MIMMVLKIVLGLIGAWFLSFAALRHGYKRGYRHGREEGFEAGRMRADDWWMNLEYETLAARKQIRQEEGWP
jgi:hypothetical protein